MIVTNSPPDELSVPHEDGVVIKIRRLSHTDMKDINDARLQGAMKLAESVPDRLLDRETKKETLTPAERIEADKAERYNTFGQFLTLLKAIVGWSYLEELNAENVAALDAKTADWLFHEIVDRNTYAINEGEALNGARAAITEGAEATLPSGSISK